MPSYLFELHELRDVSFFIHKTSGIILSLWCCLRIKWANIHRVRSIAPLVTLDHSCQHTSPSSPKHQSSYLPICSLQKTDTERHYAANLQTQVTLYISSPTSWKIMPKHLKCLKCISSSSTTTAWLVSYITEIFPPHSLWNSNTLATSCKELTHWKRPWCWEGLGAGGEGDDRGWDGWMASQTRWAWVWVNSGSLWWTGRPGMLWFMGL